jgi:hypothetical protein
MWKLYKQQGLSGSPVEESELILIRESDSLDDLKSEARKHVNKDGYFLEDKVWLRRLEQNYYELSVGEKYRIIIRDW